MALRIIADTSADYTLEDAREQDITLVPVTINVGTTSYRDCFDISHADFFKLLLSDGEPPKTSQPSPQAFLDAFNDVKESGDEAIVLLVTSKLSGTVQCANLAKEMCGYDKIHIVDSGCATAAIQLMANEAKRMDRLGATIKEILARLESMRERMRLFVGLDTLKYLYRSGRLSRVEAGIGTLANLHPLLALQEGILVVHSKCIGTKRTLRKLADTIADIRKDPAFPTRFIFSHDDTNCRALMKLLPDLATLPPLEIGPSLACHAGPGVYGAVFIEAE